MYKASLAIFLILGLGLMSLGLLYLSTDEFMPYHSEAIQADWSELDVNYRGLILGLLKALGGGAFVAGFATAFMAIASLRESAKPFVVLLPSVSTGYSTLLLYATYTIYTSTPGNPPLRLSVASVVAGLAASALLVYSTSSRNESRDR